MECAWFSSESHSAITPKQAEAHVSTQHTCAVKGARFTRFTSLPRTTPASSREEDARCGYAGKVLPSIWVPLVFAARTVAGVYVHTRSRWECRHRDGVQGVSCPVARSSTTAEPGSGAQPTLPGTSAGRPTSPASEMPGCAYTAEEWRSELQCMLYKPKKEHSSGIDFSKQCQCGAELYA